MADMVALKVKIGLKASGGAQYPDFNSLTTVLSAGMDWSQYIDRHGSGWLYDCCGHQEEDAESPRGQQWGLLLVPAAFANEAVGEFPDECELLTAADAQDFYDRRHARDMEDEEIDERLLAKIKAKQDQGLALTPEQRRAIDPRDPARGIRENRRKRFHTFNADRGFNVIDPS